MKKDNQSIFSRFGILLIMVVLFIIFTLASPVFLNWKNLNMLAVGRVITGFFALAAMLPLVAGEFDISLGYMLGMGVMIGAKVGQYTQSPLIIILSVLAATMLAGAFNGFVTVYLRIPSVVSTLGTGTMFYAVSLSLNDSLAITGTVPLCMIDFIKTKILNFNIAIWIFAVFALILFYILECAPFGKQLYAVGMSEKVSYLSGVRTKFVRFMSFVLASFYIGIGATILMCQAGNAYPTTGPSYLMSGLAVVFLSTTVHVPGRFNVPGIVQSLFMLGVLFNGISLLNAPFWTESLVNGFILITVVVTTEVFRRTLSKSISKREKKNHQIKQTQSIKKETE